jgi:glycosyltransferase involved in cell wall biosynthesis
MPLDIVMADPKAFDGQSREEGPLGGTEGAFCELAEALAAAGHRVQAFTAGARRLTHLGVTWRPLADGVPKRCDLLIANRGSQMIGLAPKARRRVFWLHNPGGHLGKLQFIAPLLRYRPTVVVLGDYHAKTLPWWIPRSRVVQIKHGITPTFQRAVPRAEPPPRRAIMTSNPERGLIWLVDLWLNRVVREVPDAELHVYSGATTYRGRKEAEMTELVQRAREQAGASVQFHAPVPAADLARALDGARLMPYGGDPGETFCRSAAEALSMGVPVVTRPVGALPERVQDGVTGFVRLDDDAFADACVALLSDDALWQRQHIAAVEVGGAWTWRQAADAFAALAE